MPGFPLTRRRRVPRRRRRALRPWLGALLVAGLVLAAIQTGAAARAHGAVYDRWREHHRAQQERALVAGETGSAPDRLVAARTAHFSVWHRADDPDAGRAAASVAEYLYDGVAALLDPDAAARWGAVTVVLHDDPWALARAVRGGAELHAAGVYHGGVIHIVSPRYYSPDGGVAQLVSAIRSDGPLAHELTHWLLDYQASGRVPRWWSEGVAQWVEREITGFVLTSPFPERARPYPVLLLDLAFNRLPDQSAAYAQALGLVDAAVAVAAPEALAEVHRRLSGGLSLGRALRDVLGVGLTDLDRAWRREVWPDAAGTD